MSNNNSFKVPLCILDHCHTNETILERFLRQNYFFILQHYHTISNNSTEVQGQWWSAILHFPFWKMIEWTSFTFVMSFAPIVAFCTPLPPFPFNCGFQEFLFLFPCSTTLPGSVKSWYATCNDGSEHNGLKIKRWLERKKTGRCSPSSPGNHWLLSDNDFSSWHSDVDSSL